MSDSATLPIDLDAPPPGIGEFYEVVNGQFVEPPLMGAYENCIASALLEAIALDFARGTRTGWLVIEVLFKLVRTPRLERRPDLAFVSYDRWLADRRIPRGATWDIVPDLAVEVVSASNTFDDVLERVDDYFQAGVRRVWAISPARGKVYEYESDTQVKVFAPTDTLGGGDVLPGFQLKLGNLFNEPAGTPE
jgi:Uma2 family endonuclease